MSGQSSQADGMLSRYVLKVVQTITSRSPIWLTEQVSIRCLVNDSFKTMSCSYFFAGFAAVESYFYALFSLGGLLSPANFPMATERDLRKITPKSTKDKYVQCCNGEAITANLARLLSDTQYDEWSRVRNTLAHRSAPGRFVYTGGSNGNTAQWTIGVDIDTNTTQIRRKWLLQTLHSLMVDTKAFVDKRVV